jgi:urease accessory protein
MTVVERTYREASLPEAAGGYRRDTMTLGWEERLRVRVPRRSDGGVEFGTSLPRGTILRGGDCLVVDEACTVVTVVEQSEAVFVLQPRTPQEWALFAHHIGNRHQPLMITALALLCPATAEVELLLEQQHIPYSRATLPFTPALAPVAHSHSH